MDSKPSVLNPKPFEVVISTTGRIGFLFENEGEIFLNDEDSIAFYGLAFPQTHATRNVKPTVVYGVGEGESDPPLYVELPLNSEQLDALSQLGFNSKDVAGIQVNTYGVMEFY